MSTEPDALEIERLRQPSAEERAAILALEAESFSNPWTAETFDAMMQSSVTQLWVVRDKGQIVAFCSCYVFGTEQLDINTVAVAASRRRPSEILEISSQALLKSSARVTKYQVVT